MGLPQFVTLMCAKRSGREGEAFSSEMRDLKPAKQSHRAKPKISFDVCHSFFVPFYCFIVFSLAWHE